MRSVQARRCSVPAETSDCVLDVVPLSNVCWVTFPASCHGGAGSDLQTVSMKCKSNVTALRKALDAERWYLKLQPKANWFCLWTFLPYVNCSFLPSNPKWSQKALKCYFLYYNPRCEDGQRWQMILAAALLGGELRELREATCFRGWMTTASWDKNTFWYLKW